MTAADPALLTACCPGPVCLNVVERDIGGTTAMDFHCSGSWPTWMASVANDLNAVLKPSNASAHPSLVWFCSMTLRFFLPRTVNNRQGVRVYVCGSSVCYRGAARWKGHLTRGARCARPREPMVGRQQATVGADWRSRRAALPTLFASIVCFEWRVLYCVRLRVGGPMGEAQQDRSIPLEQLTACSWIIGSINMRGMYILSDNSHF